MRTNILVVDDNDEIREIINVLLSSEGYEIIEAENGGKALSLMNDEIDLVILDIMMPDINGYQICQKIRTTSNVPILFLTAKGLDSDKTLGFSSGADDYLSKPFSYAEMTARVKALLRRYQVYRGKESIALTNDEILKCNDFELHCETQQIHINNQIIDLTIIEFQILALLMKNKRQIFSARDIYAKVWNEEYFYSANNTVMVHIRNIRKKIENDPNLPKHLKTIWGKGYSFE